MKPRTKREKQLVSIAKEETRAAWALTLADKEKQHKAEMVAKSTAKVEAQTKLLNAAGQAFEAIARAINASEHY